VAVDLDDGVGEGLGGLLRQVVPTPPAMSLCVYLPVNLSA
jgi:hypothetical protein